MPRSSKAAASCVPVLLSQIALHPRYDRAARPLPGFSPAPFAVPARSDCWALCVQHSACHGWTYRAAGEADAASCWLVGRVGTSRARAGPAFVSGKVCRNATQALGEDGAPPTLCAVSKLTLPSELPSVSLSCARGHIVSRVVFASYGRPAGLCLPDGRTINGARAHVASRARLESIT